MKEPLLKKNISNYVTSEKEYSKAYNKIVEKSCICVGLGESVHMVNKLDPGKEPKGVSICPGPNMAYFSKIMSLKEMTDHIYGRNNFLSNKDRPHMFLKELKLNKAGSLQFLTATGMSKPHPFPP